MARVIIPVPQMLLSIRKFSIIHRQYCLETFSKSVSSIKSLLWKIVLLIEIKVIE